MQDPAHSNMYYNPNGYYYAPATLYFSGRSDDSESTGNKRDRKQRRKSKDHSEYETEHQHSRHHKHRPHRVNSAYINNRIPLYIVPTRMDNRMLLHAYPIKDYCVNRHDKSRGHHGSHKEGIPQPAFYGHENFEFVMKPKEERMYVKKLEYSADKVSILNNLKNSEKKEKRHNKENDRSVEVDNRSRDYFSLKKNDRKNTLSGHKRPSISSHEEHKPECKHL